ILSKNLGVFPMILFTVVKCSKSDTIQKIRQGENEGFRGQRFGPLGRFADDFRALIAVLGVIATKQIQNVVSVAVDQDLGFFYLFFGASSSQVANSAMFQLLIIAKETK